MCVVVRGTRIRGAVLAPAPGTQANPVRALRLVSSEVLAAAMAAPSGFEKLVNTVKSKALGVADSLTPVL